MKPARYTCLKTAIALAALALVIFAREANAQDVYNFYFQKSLPPTVTTNGVPAPSTPAAASPPTTGATGAETPSPAVAAPSTTATTPTPPVASLTTAVPATKKEDPKNWQVNVGYGRSVDHQKTFSGLSFGGEYAFNKYIGLQGQVFTGKAQRWYGEGEFDNTTHFGGSAGVKLTPIHVQLFGWNFIELSALMGGLSSTYRDPDRTGDFRIATYVGFGIAVNLSENVALTTNVQFEEADTAYGNSVTSLAVRF